MSKPRKRRVLRPGTIPAEFLGIDLKKKLLFGPRHEVVSGVQFKWKEDYVVKPK